MKKRRSLKCFLLTACLAACLLALPLGARAKTSTTTVSASTLEKGRQFLMTGMPYNGVYSPLPRTLNGKSFTVRSVQNFAYTPDGKYIFTVSEGYTGELKDGKKHTILCRCSVPSKTGSSAEAVCQDALILEGFGHGETIEITQPNLKSETYYIWVGCKPNTIGSYLGTDIKRMTYKVSASGKGTITKKVELKNFHMSGVTVKKKKATATTPLRNTGKVTRVGVAADPACKRIAFRVEGSGTNYLIYDYKKLNAALDKVKNGKSYDMKNAASMQLVDIRSNLRPLGTYQSFDIDTKYIYICGGHMSIGATIFKIPYSAGSAGKGKTQILDDESKIKQKINITQKLTVNGRSYGKADLEIEGMKIKTRSDGKTDYYVNFVLANTPTNNSIGIYKFTK